MGQYYNILIKQNNKYTVYDRSTLDSDGNSRYMMAKLTEHSWIGNSTMDSFSSIIYKKPTQIAWVGDYANEKSCKLVNNLTKNQINNLHKKAYSLPEKSLEYIPLNTKYMLLVNWTKKIFIDMYEYIEKNTLQSWCLHPLSLLTAVGNGLGGGDYRDINEDKIGSWCFDKISFEPEDMLKKLQNDGFVKTEYEFIESYLKQPQYTYLLQVDYSSADTSDVYSYIFNNRETAIIKLKEFIEKIKQDSWANQIIDNDGTIAKDFNIDTNIEETEEIDLWWNATYEFDKTLHVYIDLKKVEIE